MVSTRPKISVIGVGQIGSMASLFIAQKNLGDVVLFDIVPGMPKGKALDQFQMSPIQQLDCKFLGTNNYEDTANSDVVVVIAGMPRKPGMSRDDLVAINGKIIREVGANIKLFSPSAFVVCVTNPLDVMVQILQQATGFPPNRVVGMGGILDAARMKTCVASKLDVSVADVETVVLGGHGDTMVPLVRMTSVGGVPLSDFVKSGALKESDVDEIVERTRHGGAEVLGLLGSGSAYHAPAAAATQMVEAYIRDRKRVMCCCAHLTGQYGITGHYIGVPVVIGGGGVERIIEISLEPKEMEQFNQSAEAVIKLQKAQMN